MLRVVYGNRTEKLVEALADAAGGSRDRTLAPLRVVVPNRNVEGYLRLQLAQRLGICANLKVHFLRRLLAELLEDADPPARMADRPLLLAGLLAALQDQALLGRPECAPLAAWLAAGGEAARPVRVAQLASRLSFLFEEYGYSRQEELAGWARRRPWVREGPLVETEAWQRLLWLRLLGPDGLLARASHDAGERVVGPHQLLPALRDARVRLPEVLHIFGVSYVAPAFQQVFLALAERCEVRLYTLNPCQEYWEDVRGRPSPAPALGARGQLSLFDTFAAAPASPVQAASVEVDEADPLGLLRDSDPLPLRLWARPGRENIRLLNDLCGGDFDDAFVDPCAEGESLLRRVQQSVLRRVRGEALPLAPGDTSLRIVACPSMRREAEAIASSIVQLMQDDARIAAERGSAPLRLNQVAVLLPARDRALYVDHLSAAFAEQGLLHSVGDAPLPERSRVAKLVMRLLALPGGSFSRKEMLGVLAHPCVLAQLGDPAAEAVAHLCHRLGIVRGADASDWPEAPEAAAAFSWEAGLQRAAAGAFVAGERSGEAGRVELGARVLAAEELSDDDRGLAARLGLLARSLFADCRALRAGRLSLRGWSEALVALVRSYVEPRTEIEERDLDRCLGELLSLRELDQRGDRVPYALASELATERLSQLEGPRGQELSRGVVVSTLQPMRSLPFAAIYLAGLGEGAFPAVEPRDPLDLRLSGRKAGDVDARDRDRYLFLEALLCARERLTLSYVCRDALTGDELLPSPLISELGAALKDHGADAKAAPLLVRLSVPRAEGQPELGPLSPSAALESWARAAGEQVGGASRAEPAALAAAVAGEPATLLQKGLGLLSAPADTQAGAPGRSLRLSLSQLRKFLECPLQGAARVALGLREDEELDAFDAQDEPLELSRLSLTVFARGVFERWMRARASGQSLDLDATLARELAWQAARGRGPAGLFEAGLRARLQQDLGCWRDQADQLGLSGLPVRRINFGAAVGRVPGDEVQPALVLDVALLGGLHRVELVGETELLAGDCALKLELKDEGKGLRGTLGAYVSAAVLRAAGLPAPRRVLQLSCGEAERHLLRAPDPQAARGWLETLVQALFCERHDLLFPIEAALQVAQGKSAEQAVRSLLEGTQGFSSQYGPIRPLDDYEPPTEDAARAIVAGRLSPWLVAVQEGP